ALSFAVSSLAHHDRLDAEEKKVETAICGFAEKLVVNGDPADATRLLSLASSFSGKPMRVEGHRMNDGDTGDTGRAGVRPPRDHPYAALAFMLSLSGSQRWATAAAANTTAQEGQDEAEADPSLRSNSARKAGSRRSPRTAPSEEGNQQGEQEEGGGMFGLGGDSSRLWSTDSERDEESEEKSADGGSRGVARPLTVLSGDAEEAGTQEWLRAFESDGERSPRTDGNGTDDSEMEAFHSRWGEPASEGKNGIARDIPPPTPSASSSPMISAADARNDNPGGRYSQPLDPAGRYPYSSAVRHNYGASCTGADIRSLRGNPGGESASRVPPFLRPCQTLEAYQTQGGAAAWRRRSIPEAEVVRAALHMLQGLSGDIFVRVDGPADRKIAGRGDRDHHPRAKAGVAERTGGRRSAGRGTGQWDGFRSSRSSGSTESQQWFSLSGWAESDLAVASLSPEALASVLGDLVRVGSTAEYLRAFVADAVASVTIEATAVAAAARSLRGNSCRGKSTRTDGSSSQERTADGNGETIVGLLSLLQPQVETLELTRQLVEAGAGWWVSNLPE
ncbi:unnamed protein product, partial [Hapterophycus canaliculatus]